MLVLTVWTISLLVDRYLRHNHRRHWELWSALVTTLIGSLALIGGAYMQLKVVNWKVLLPGVIWLVVSLVIGGVIWRLPDHIKRDQKDRTE